MREARFQFSRPKWEGLLLGKMAGVVLFLQIEFFIELMIISFFPVQLHYLNGWEITIFPALFYFQFFPLKFKCNSV